MKLENCADEVKRIVRRWPIAMPARPAYTLLGLCDKTFHQRVSEGCIRYRQDSPKARKRYMTDHILQMMGVER